MQRDVSESLTTGGRIINVSSEGGLRAWPFYSADAPGKFEQIGQAICINGGVTLD
jgi:hypothetical protein